MNHGVRVVLGLLVLTFVVVPVTLRVFMGPAKWDRPFVDDAAVLGTWDSVDFVRNIEDFVPGQKQWKGDLFLKGLTFKQHGSTSNNIRWTRGHIWFAGDDAEGRYSLRDIDGRTYLFLEWVNGDVSSGQQKPSFYVLERKG